LAGLLAAQLAGCATVVNGQLGNFFLKLCFVQKLTQMLIISGSENPPFILQGFQIN